MKTNPKWKFTTQVPTKDDFCPTFPDGTVQVNVSLNEKTSCVRISVWGDDDLGFERDEYIKNKGDAKNLFRIRKNEILKWKNVSINSLIKAGFVRA